MNAQPNYGLTCKGAMHYRKDVPAIIDIFRTMKSYRMASGQNPSKIEVGLDFGYRLESETGCKMPLNIDGTVIDYQESKAMLDLCIGLMNKLV